MPGGLGAEAGGDFFLTAGTTLTLLVGGKPPEGGGGGGSFVFGSGATTLVAAGGGGGGGFYMAMEALALRPPLEARAEAFWVEQAALEYVLCTRIPLATLRAPRKPLTRPWPFNRTIPRPTRRAAFSISPSTNGRKRSRRRGGSRKRPQQPG